MANTYLTRDKLTEPREVHIDALSDPAHNTICPINLLLIIALHTGQVHATTLGQLLHGTATRDRKVVWRNPSSAMADCSWLRINRPELIGCMEHCMLDTSSYIRYGIWQPEKISIPVQGLCANL